MGWHPGRHSADQVRSFRETPGGPIAFIFLCPACGKETTDPVETSKETLCKKCSSKK